ncbi:MAG: amidase family protein [Proteobacteria bacterium]|nr:amidase family protein [Pseudomonadota bacterium]
MVGGQNIDRPPPDALHASTPPEGGVISLSPIPLKGLRIGVIKEFADVEISADMKRIMDEHLRALEMKGAELITVSIPNILDALAAYYIIAPAEASSNLARYDGMRYGLRVDGRDLIDTYKKTRAAGFGTEVQRRMVVGTAVLSSESYEVYFMQAARVRRLIDEAFTRAFGQCDLIICPASAGPAFPLSDELSPLDAYALDLFTVAMDLSGLPACSVPAGMSGGVACPPSGGGLSAEPTGGGSVLDSKNSPPSPPSAVLPPKGGETRLPLGLQVVGRRFDDVRVLQLAKHIEAASALDNRPTKVMGE